MQSPVVFGEADGVEKTELEGWLLLNSSLPISLTIPSKYFCAVIHNILPVVPGLAVATWVKPHGNWQATSSPPPSLPPHATKAASVLPLHRKPFGDPHPSGELEGDGTYLVASC